MPQRDEEVTISGEQVESLRVSAAAINRDLKDLTKQVATLIEAVASLAPSAAHSTPAPVATTAAPAAPAAPPEHEAVEEGPEMTVTVAPLPELAMAAVAETTLRGLPGVRAVKGVKRERDWARFTLEVSPGTDLVTEMKAAMPVPFKVRESTEEAVSLDLQWAWGTS